MDWLSFISKLIEDMAWPASFIAAIVFLRSPIFSILPNLKTLKVKDVELSFGEAIRSIQHDISVTTGNANWEVTSTKDLKPNMAKLAEKSPLGVVLQAWDSFESTIKVCAERHAEVNFHSVGEAIEWLESNTVIKGGYINLYYRLKALKTRFSAFENEELPNERALEYSDTALAIAREIREACNA